MNVAGGGADPLVSVVVTTYNYGAYLPEALESVLAQDYPRTEIVVVDDGSTDDTREVVAPFLERGVRYLHQENAGPAAARNAGIGATAGPLVAFLDADDAWLRAKLSLQVAHLRSHPEVGLVSGAYLSCDEENRPLSVMGVPEVPSGRLFEDLLVRNVVHNPTVVLARRACFEAAGDFTGTAPPVEDWDLWIRIAKAFPIGFVTEPVAKRRRHTRAISRDAEIDWPSVIDGLVGRHIEDVPPGRQDSVRRRSRANARFLAAVTVSRRSRAAAAAQVVRSLLLDPGTMAREKLVFLLRVLLPRSLFALARRGVRRRGAGTLPERV